MKTFHIDDTGIKTILEVRSKKKVILRKRFPKLSDCLRWLHTNSKKASTKEAVEELVSMKNFIKDSKFKFKIKEVEDG